MIRISLLFMMLLAFYPCVSQTGIEALPPVKPEDLKPEASLLDPEAGAVILHDIGSTEFIESTNRIKNVFEKTTRIKIITKDGYKYATADIPFYTEKYGSEDIRDFTAVSYTLEDGEIIKTRLTKDDFVEEDINEWWKRKKFTFSNIKEGSIIEYSYKIISPYNVHLRKWYFQHDIPVKKSTYKIGLCPFYNYIVLNMGYIEYDRDTTYIKPFGFTLMGDNYKTKIYEWELNNVPAFKKEKYITSAEDYRMKVEFQLESYYGYYGGKFQLMNTWEELIKELDTNDSFGDYMVGNEGLLLKMLDGLKLEDKADYEKARLIHKFVTKNFYWNEISGVYTTQSKRSMINSKTGSVADINLLFVSLLNAAGVEAYPVLISTRKHGRVFYQYPFLNLFNYVAVLIKAEETEFFADATEPLLPLGILPYRCMNQFGLKVKKCKKDEKAEFYPLVPALPHKKSTFSSLQINTDEEKVNAKILNKTNGYEALRWRKMLKENGEGAVSEKISEKNDVKFLNSLEAKEIDQSDKDLVLTFEVESTLDKIEDKIFIDPFLIAAREENAFKSQQRIYPVDYGYNNDEKLISTINIPAGYNVEYLPENFSTTNAENTLQFNFVVQHSGGIIQVMSHVKRLKSIYEPEEYDELKEFFDQVVDRQSEKIVLRKAI